MKVNGWVDERISEYLISRTNPFLLYVDKEGCTREYLKFTVLQKFLYSELAISHPLKFQFYAIYFHLLSFTSAGKTIIKTVLFSLAAIFSFQSRKILCAYYCFMFLRKQTLMTEG